MGKETVGLRMWIASSVVRQNDFSDLRGAYLLEEQPKSYSVREIGQLEISKLKYSIILPLPRATPNKQDIILESKIYFMRSPIMISLLNVA